MWACSNKNLPKGQFGQWFSLRRFLVSPERAIAHRSRACKNRLAHKIPFVAINHPQHLTEGTVSLLASNTLGKSTVPRGCLVVLWLVGLLTSEPRFPGLLTVNLTTMAERIGNLAEFCHSGGAVPEFHRSSLFVDRSNGARRPPTHDACSEYGTHRIEMSIGPAKFIFAWP
jgi:hypothetical protein